MTPAEISALLSPTPLPIERPQATTASGDPLDDLRTALQNNDVAAVTQLAHSIPPRLLNTIRVMRDVVENFNPQTADPLFKKGLSIKKLWSNTGWSAIPPVDFWPWFVKLPTTVVSEEDRTYVWQKSWGVLTSEEPVGSPVRQTAAHARQALASFKEFDNRVVLTALSTLQSKFSRDDWDSIRAWPKSMWSESSVVMWSEPHGVIDVQGLLKVIEEVPHAAAALSAYQQLGKQFKEKMAQWCASPSGEIEDLPLVQLASPSKRQKLISVLKNEVNANMLQSPAWDVYTRLLNGEFPGQATDLLPKSIQNTIEEYGQEYWFTSVFDLFVRNGLEYLPHLPSTPEVEQSLLESLNEPEMAGWMLCITDVSNTTPLQLLERFPVLRTWKDRFGNSAFHWIADGHDNTPVSKSFISFLIKNEDARQPNNFGHTPMDVLLANNSVTPHSHAKYEKAIVQQSLKEDAALASKLRFRSKTGSRKM